MKKFLLLLLGGVVLFSCGKKNPTLAVVGSERITARQLADKINTLPATYRQYLATETGKKQYLENLVKEELVLAAARKAKIHRQKEYARRIREFEKELRQKIKEYKEQLLLELYLSELNKYALNISSGEVRDYYQKHLNDFRNPRAVGLSHILVASPEEANQAYQRLKKGEDFAKIAAAISIDPGSAPRGGDLGIIQPGETLPELEGTIKNLKIGEISAPVKTQFGYHILKKTSEKSLTPKDLGAAEYDIRRILLKNKFEQWLGEQEKKMKVKINYEQLSAVQINPPSPENYFLPSEQSDKQK